MKKFSLRFINGFCYSIAITAVIHAAVLFAGGELLMLEEYMMHFDSPLKAYVVQLLMIGVMSGITSGGTIVFEAKKIGLLAQSIFFLMILLSAWIPVACIAWGFHKYTLSMITTICSIVVTYGICWVIQYRLCRRDIEAINAKLSVKKGE